MVEHGRLRRVGISKLLQRVGESNGDREYRLVSGGLFDLLLLRQAD